jgi:hypothetical protein
MPEEANMATKKDINGAATYARFLLTSLVKEQDSTEREDLTNELVAQVLHLSDLLAEQSGN